MTSLDSVRPSPVDVKPGPPGAVATAGPPKSMARFGRGAGATGAPTSVSPEKSIARPPNGSGATGVASSTEVSVAAPGFVPFRLDGSRTDAPTRSVSEGCLLIDANIPPRRYPGGVSRVAELRQQRAAEQLELVGLPDVANAEQDVLRTGVTELAEPIDDLVGGLGAAAAVTADIHTLERGPLDLLERPPDGLAVAAQDLPLVMDVLGPAEDVRCVGVLGHKPKRLPLAAAADHDRNARARDRLRRVEQPGGTELATVEGALGAGFALEHLVRDPEGLLELLEADAQRREGDAQGVRLLLVPRGAKAQPGATAGQDVERRRSLDPDRGQAVGDPADHQPDARSLRHRADPAQRRPTLQHRLVDGADRPDLEQVIHDPDGVEADLVRGPDDPLERRRDARRAAGIRERGDLEPELHAAMLAGGSKRCPDLDSSE